MCEKCVDLEHQIRNYQQLALAFANNALLKDIAEAVAGLELEKAALHPKSVK